MNMRRLIQATCLFVAVGSSAATAQAEDVEVRNAWVRWLPGGAPMAGYFVLENLGQDAIALTGASSAAYGSASLHETVQHDDETTSMQPIDLPLMVAGESSVRFEPGGYHLMLRQPQRSLSPGDRIRIEFATASGRPVQATFTVRSPTGE